MICGLRLVAVFSNLEHWTQLTLSTLLERRTLSVDIYIQGPSFHHTTPLISVHIKESLGLSLSSNC